MINDKIRSMNIDYYKFKVDEAKMQEIKDYYHVVNSTTNKNSYEIFNINVNNVHVVCYNSKKLYTVVFSGQKDKVKLEVETFFQNALPLETNQNKNQEWEDVSYQIGSDEVGVGDFFLGFYICATYLQPQDVKLITELGVKDSKKLSDSKIEQIGPILIEKIKKYMLKISPNKLYQYKISNFSTHKILALGHSFAQEQLILKYHLSNDIPIYIDQFEKEEIYLRYSKTTLKNPMIFKTKGETFFPSVAASSVIARYCFLQDWQKMEEHFHTKIPKGASSEVDKTYKNLLKNYPQEDVDNYVKRFFRNYKD